MKTQAEDDTRLTPGSVVAGNNGEYIILKLLGEGGFGAVYRVQYKNSGGQSIDFAMKVEKKLERRKHSKLKMEVAILKDIGSMCDNDVDDVEMTPLLRQKRLRMKEHFTDIVDRGKKSTYFFLVMTLVGPSLDDMKRQRPRKVFSLGTGLSAGIQCLECVECLHSIGYIHRDLKPANYARGLNNKTRMIYLLDFGIARKFKNDKNEIKTPRKSVPFKGTVRFASMSCHRYKETGPRDDCESWFYLLLDCIVPSGLPWKRFPDRAEVLKCKEDLRKNVERRHNSLFNGIPYKDYVDRIMEYIDGLEYVDKIDYDFIYESLKLTANECKVSLDDPFDWEHNRTLQSKRRAPNSSMSYSTMRSMSRIE